MPGKSIAKVGGKAIRFIAVARCVKNYASQFARGLSPVSADYLMAFKCHSCPAPFGDVLGPILCELGALARNPLLAFPRRAEVFWLSVGSVNVS